ncbi:MAG: AAA family ATPase, partial [Acetatifactor sp.]|nr:AAA family ATPase [Acetatifactor sp.]
DRNEAEDVPGSLRYAIKEAEEYLGDLVYLGESADYLEDVSWEEDGFLPFGDASEAENPELFSDKREEREEDIEDIEEEFDKWMDANREKSSALTEYWAIAEEMKQCVLTIRNKNNSDNARAAAAASLKRHLEKCLSDVNLSSLTAIYKDKKEENVIGYNPEAASAFVRRMVSVYPKPEPSNAEKMEKETADEVSMQQLLMQAGAVECELKGMVFGQDVAIEKLRAAYFDRELTIRLQPNKGGPRNVYLLAGPPGVGKTFMAKLFAEKLGFPFQQFDMASYSGDNAERELQGYARQYKDTEKGGVLTEYVNKKPRCVLLFDEIEKADGGVIRLFLQILEEGVCTDRFHEKNVSFKDTIIFFTTNAGRQLYENAQNENLTLLPEKVVIDALEKDINPRTGQPYFPPEILSRMSSYTVLMMNHLKADVIFKLVEKDIKNRLKKIKKEYGYDLKQGKEYLARTILYSMGGSADARNASKIAGKFISKEMYELLKLLEEKQGLDESGMVRRIEWKCDFEDAPEEIRDFYSGERDCVIPVFGTVKYEPAGRIKNNNVCVKNTVDINAFMKMIHKENVLFAVIDYIYGLESAGNGLNVVDARTLGREVFLKLREEDKEVPVYILDGSCGHVYTEKEKNTLLKKGAGGFIESKYFKSQLEQTYLDVCCQVVMGTLTARHQVLTYETKKEFDEKTNVGSIIFGDFKLETAVESEDKSSMLSDDLRPSKSWDEIYVSEDLKKELEFFIHYLQNPKKYKKKGVKPRGILLYGPPGTGKTSLAKVVASESGVNFLSIGASELLNGGPEKVQDEFRIARKYAPAILFIDEIDAIGTKREYSYLPNPVLNALLNEMDGFKKVDGKPVFVMAATNHESRIDFALQRRFDRSFEMGFLDKKGRRWVLEKLIKKQSDMFDVSEEKMESIVDRSERVSPAKLEQVVEADLREGIRSDRIIDDELFDEIFEKCTMGEEKVISSQKEIECTAYHEAGHALIHLYYGEAPSYMSIVARGNHGGYTLTEMEELCPSKEYWLERICAALGGRAAELVFKYGLTSGAASD